MKKYIVEVARTGIGFMNLEVEASNEEEALEKALDDAPNHVFSEKSSEYDGCVMGVKE